MTLSPAPQSPTWPAGVSLLLGLGAQKAGTTWLHETLSKHPECHPFPMKEVHYFDTVDGVSQSGYVLTDLRLKALRRTSGRQDELEWVRQLSDLLYNPEPTHQTYVDLVTNGVAPGAVALDITPSYAMVGDDMFAQMAQMEPTRFIYILREPVARFWSAVRMMANLRRVDAAAFQDAARAVVDSAIGGDPTLRQNAAMARGDYAGTLAKMERHIPAHRRMVLFFEDLFTQVSLDRICAFIGVSPLVLHDTTPRLEGVSAALRADQIARLTQVFRPQYDAVCAAFGDAVPQSWHERFAQGSVPA